MCVQGRITGLPLPAGGDSRGGGKVHHWFPHASQHRTPSPSPPPPGRGDSAFPECVFTEGYMALLVILCYNSQMASNPDTIFGAARKAGASDVHMAVGSPVLFRI